MLQTCFSPKHGWKKVFAAFDDGMSWSCEPRQAYSEMQLMEMDAGDQRGNTKQIHH